MRGGAARLAMGAALVAMLATACGQPTVGGQVIGVRPAVASDARTATLDTSSISKRVDDELNYATSVPAIQENALAYGLLPLDSTLTLRQSEHLAALQLLGETVIQSRLAALASVRYQVGSARGLSAYAKYRLTSLLDASIPGLKAMEVRIAQDQIIDQARLDVSVVASFRIYGFVLPQVHMLIAAYELQTLAQTYASIRDNLQRRIASAATAGLLAQPYVNDLTAEIAIMNSIGYGATNTLSNLSAAAYAASKQSLKAVRPSLLRAKSASDRGQTDISAANSILGFQ